MPSGNCLVDKHETSDCKSFKCNTCFGKGSIEWVDMEKMFDELAFIAYKRKKNGNPITTFREALRVARVVKSEGQECPECYGTGEVYI